MPKYIELKPSGDTVSGKPEQFIHSKRHGNVLGRICWYPAWRQWVFESAPNAIWSEDCLADVRAFILELQKGP